jgi:HEAT repeat protein
MTEPKAPVSLFAVRSQPVDGVLAYLAAADADLSVNPLLDRFGLRLDALRIPLKVIPHRLGDHEAELRRQERARADPRGHRRTPQREERDEEGAARMYAMDLLPKDASPDLLDPIEPKLKLGVILGDPGSGKSEWLKALARRTGRAARGELIAAKALEDRVSIPVFLHLREVAAALAHRADLKRVLAGVGEANPAVRLDDPAFRTATALLLAVRQRYAPLRFKPPAERMLWRKLTLFGDTTPAETAPLLCLDGWDECAEHHDLLKSALRAYAAAARARIFVASRIVGYGDNPLFERPHRGDRNGDRRELRLCAFDYANTRDFITIFFGENRREIAIKLIEELRGKHAVAGMAQNPLLATLLSIAYQPDPESGKTLELPLRRVDLYQEILQGLLAKWPDQRSRLQLPDTRPEPDKEAVAAEMASLVKEFSERHPPPQTGSLAEWSKYLRGPVARLPITHPVRKLLAPPTDQDIAEPARHMLVEDKLALLLQLAEHMFPKQVITRKELHEWLWGQAGYLTILPISRPLHKLLLARQHQDMPEILCHDGVLMRVGADSFAFIHLTFQEFLTADAFAAKGWPAIAECIDRVSWHGAWEEVIVMLAGRLTDAGPLLDMLANENTDDVLRHRTILAALCLPEISERNRWRVQAKITEITELVVRGCQLEHKAIHGEATVGEIDHYRRGLVAVAEAKGYLLDAPIVSGLLERIHLGRSNEASQLLEWIGGAAATPECLTKIIRWLADDQTDHWMGLCLLRRFGPAAATPQVLSAIAGLLTLDNGNDIRFGALALMEMGPAAATSPILAELARVIMEPKDRSNDWFIVRLPACEAFGRLVLAKSPDQGLQFLHKLISTPGPDIWQSILELIDELGEIAATEVTLGWLEEMFVSRKEPRGSFPQWMRRCHAARAIGKIGAKAATDKMLKELLKMLNHMRTEERMDAADALRTLGEAAAKPWVVASLVKLLHSSRYYARRGATAGISALAKYAVCKEPGLFPLIVSLLGDVDAEVRAEAALATSEICNERPEFIHRAADALVSLLDDKSAWVRTHALEGLEKLNSAYPITRPEMLLKIVRLLADPDAKVRATTARGIPDFKMPLLVADVLQQLIHLLSDDSEEGKLYKVGEAAATALGRLAAQACLSGDLKVLHSIPTSYRLRALFTSLPDWAELRLFHASPNWKVASLSELISGVRPLEGQHRKPAPRINFPPYPLIPLRASVPGRRRE